MNRAFWRTLVAFAAAAALAMLLSLTGGPARAQSAPATTAMAPGAGPKTAAEQYKNVQVLKDIPADQLFPAMQFISASLGVECNYCHVEAAPTPGGPGAHGGPPHLDFEKDDKKEKKTARKMIQMELAINKDNFDGHTDVTCYSCHRGAHEPVGTPIISEEEPKPEPEGPKPGAPQPALPTADQILEKYVQAMGGADALQKISSRIEKGSIAFGENKAPVEVYSKAPDKRATVTHMGNGESVTAYDGHVGWLSGMGRPREMTPAETEAFKLDADFYLPVHMKQIFNQLRVRPPEKIGDGDAYQVVGLRQGQPPVRFYFDEQSGLLVREVRYAQTPLGRMPTQIDYADYRDADGVKVICRWTLARPGTRFTIQIDQVQQNVPIDDAKFTEPAKN
ncbi:MAG TPA: c-type cytochrome [Terriglobia bacterium]|nr:c-type cytochrome [Terriglobia bacterium]